MATAAQYNSAIVERDVITPAGESYTWMKVRGWSGNPEFSRYFAPNEEKELSGMFAFQVAVEDEQMRTRWIDVVLYDDNRTGATMATEMAEHMLDTNAPKVGFFTLEGYVKPETFTDRAGVEQVRSKLIAKQITCSALRPYNTAPVATPAASIFGSCATEPATPQMAAEPSAAEDDGPVFPSEITPPVIPQKATGSLTEAAAKIGTYDSDAPF